MQRKQAVAISKTLSYILRHKEETPLDKEGWVDIKIALDDLKNERPKLGEISKEDLLIVSEKFEKKRFEIQGDKIRAKYGHSREDPIEHVLAEPPEVLYHGTSSKTVGAILAGGIQKMDRQYVHLSHEKDTAQLVGTRHHKRTAILVIDAKAAWEGGIKFYFSSDTWLSEDLPAEYIKEIIYSS